MKNFIILILFLVCIPAYGQERVNMDVRVVTLEGTKRLAFTKEDAKKLLQMRVDFPKLEALIDKQKKSIANNKNQINIYEDLLINTNQQIKVLGKMNGDLAERAIESDKWYNNGWLWFSIGVIIGVGTTTAVVIGAK